MFIDRMCRTRSLRGPENPDPDQKCEFPFEHHTKRYDLCIEWEGRDYFWCKTGKEANKWGQCNDACTLKRSKCVIYHFRFGVYS